MVKTVWNLYDVLTPSIQIVCANFNKFLHFSKSYGQNNYDKNEKTKIYNVKVFLNRNRVRIDFQIFSTTYRKICLDYIEVLRLT